jgi:hypothetical protein
MEDPTPKKINWKEIARSIRISFTWYVLILAFWWMMGIYPEILFSLKAQIIIAGLSSLMSFLQTKK